MNNDISGVSMYTYNAIVGDWSDDGHGRTETFTLSTNKSKEDINNAYLKTEKIAKISLIGTKGCKGILSDYEDDSLDINVYQKLLSIGVDLSSLEGVKEFNYDKEEYDSIPIYNKDCVKLYMEMAKVSLPDLSYEIQEPEELIKGIGYGLFI